MKKRLLGSIVLALFLTSAAAFASDVVTLGDDIEKPAYSTGDINKNLKGSLLVNDSETLSEIIDKQKDHDIKDLEKLWQGTVENNQVIEFALKKLSTPESQHFLLVELLKDF